MTFGGGDGRPGPPFGGDPFGGNQFSGNPFGGNQFGAPPVISAPPPSQHPERNNVLATLSVVFAFIFAPAGAVMGRIWA
jgi:hypothetical protein